MNILFMCVANSARSQIAEGLARKIFGEKARVESAGSQPAGLNPLATTVMSEIGMDISRQYSKSVEDLDSGFLSRLDYVITLCADEVCPTVLSKARKLYWPLPDPAGKGGCDEERLQRFREVRDELQTLILEFSRSTGIGPEFPPPRESGGNQAT